jgi:hypothetical protein
MDIGRATVRLDLVTSSSFAVRLLDSVIRVTAGDDACGAARQLWRGTLCDIPPGAVTADITVDDRLDLATSLGQIATRLNAAALDAARQFTVHAGVVASGDAAIVLPAVSGAGKSTLTAACVLAGLAYVSDEALSVSPAGDGAPYPRPVGLSEHSAALLGVAALGMVAGDERLLAPEDLGAVAGDAVRVAHVVVLDRRVGASASLAPLPALDAVRLLLENSFNHFRAPVEAVEAASRIAGGARVWRLAYGEAPDAAQLLTSLLD